MIISCQYKAKSHRPFFLFLLMDPQSDYTKTDDGTLFNFFIYLFIVKYTLSALHL